MITFGRIIACMLLFISIESFSKRTILAAYKQNHAKAGFINLDGESVSKGNPVEADG